MLRSVLILKRRRGLRAVFIFCDRLFIFGGRWGSSPVIAVVSLG